MEAHLQYLAVPVLLYVAWRSFDYARGAYHILKMNRGKTSLSYKMNCAFALLTTLVTLFCLWNIVALENWDVEKWRSFSVSPAEHTKRVLEDKLGIEGKKPDDIRDMIEIRPPEKK
jgi:hypothetical protein